MQDRGHAGLAVLLGAVLGGVAGYLLFTDHGKRLRAQLEPKLAELLTTVQQWRGTIETVRAAVLGEEAAEQEDGATPAGTSRDGAPVAS